MSCADIECKKKKVLIKTCDRNGYLQRQFSQSQQGTKEACSNHWFCGVFFVARHGSKCLHWTNPLHPHGNLWCLFPCQLHFSGKEIERKLG